MPYTALYRQFRPASFEEILGQESIVKTLKGQLKNNRINHAYLFCGPRGIGKTTAARIFSKAINCLEPVDGSACQKCSACLALGKSNNFDIIEIDAASNNKVDNIRDLRENIKFMPVAGKYRVYIIDEVHMLSKSAFNALLKTLEEPPEHIVFIMATTEPNKLPVTVLSRCQRFDFKRIPMNKLIELITDIAKRANINIEDDAIAAIARASQGGARDAISLLDQCNAFGGNNISIKDVSAMLGSANSLLYFALSRAIIEKDIKRALQGLNMMIETGSNVLTIASDIMGHFRDLFMAKHVKDISSALAIDEASAARYNSQAKKASDGALLRCMEIFSTLEGQLRFASKPRIWVELAVSKACRVEDKASYDNLLMRIEKLENITENLSSNNNISNEDDKKSDDYLYDIDETSKEISEEYNTIKEEMISKEDINPAEADKAKSEDADRNKKADIENKNKEIEIPVPDNEYFPYADPPPEDEATNDFTNVFDEYADGLKEDVQEQSEEIEQGKRHTLKQSLDVLLEDVEKDEDPHVIIKENIIKKDDKTISPKKLWTKIMDELKRQSKMSLVIAMKKGNAKSLSGNILKVVFPPDALTTLDRLKMPDNKMLILDAAKKVYGEKINVEFIQQQLEANHLDMLDKVNSSFPKDSVVVKYN